MSTSRAESQQPQYGRRRSNTTQSILRPVPPQLPPIPLQFGDSTILNTWVHDTKESVILNSIYWPGVAEGDLLSVSPGIETSAQAFIFVVPKDDPTLKQQLQVRFIFTIRLVCVLTVRTSTDIRSQIDSRSVWLEE